MRHDEQKPDMRHEAKDEAATLAEILFPQSRLCVDPAWMHRKHDRLFREVPWHETGYGKSAEAIVLRLTSGRAEHKESTR